MRVRFFFFLTFGFLADICEKSWSLAHLCAEILERERERERERGVCAENVYMYSIRGVVWKWGYRNEKGFVYLGSGHECWVCVSDELWLILGVTRVFPTVWLIWSQIICQVFLCVHGCKILITWTCTALLLLSVSDRGIHIRCNTPRYCTWCNT